jgi:hypothetical protein
MIVFIIALFGLSGSFGNIPELKSVNKRILEALESYMTGGNISEQDRGVIVLEIESTDRDASGVLGRNRLSILISCIVDDDRIRASPPSAYFFVRGRAVIVYCGLEEFIDHSQADIERLLRAIRPSLLANGPYPRCKPTLIVLEHD